MILTTASIGSVDEHLVGVLLSAETLFYSDLFLAIAYAK